MISPGLESRYMRTWAGNTLLEMYASLQGQSKVDVDVVTLFIVFPSYMFQHFLLSSVKVQ